MNVAIVVHGRWDAFDLARELDRRGVCVQLFTNYPPHVVAGYDVPPEKIRCFWPHGVLSRIVARSGSTALRARAEPALHVLFGRWAARQVRHKNFDVAYIFSGVAEEAFRALARKRTLRVLVRESSHIRFQDRLLREEELRTGIHLPRPSAWMIGREEREYALADQIRVLSSFTYDTFTTQGIPVQKLRLVRSGARLGQFRPGSEVLERRCERIVAGEPLRVLNVGTFGMRKGAWDMAEIVRELSGEPFQFRFVGPIAGEAADLAAELEKDSHVAFTGKLAEAALPAAYAWGDVFMLPTIEDGFQAVLAQAAASGLPILTTPNGAGCDLVQHGHNGWVLPIRTPSAFVDHLRWASTQRTRLAHIVRETCIKYQPRDFSHVAAELEEVWRESLPAAGIRGVFPGSQDPILLGRP